MEDAECSDCKEKFEDIKSIALCTLCKRVYHVSCQNIDLRGFHLRKSSWRCKACEGEASEENRNAKQGRNRKRSRTEETYVEQSDVDLISATLRELVESTNGMKIKLDFLIKENAVLKNEIKLLRQSTNTVDSIQPSIQPVKTYASATKNDTNVLVIKQKGEQSNAVKVKKDIREKVDPSDLGVGLSMGPSTKRGGIVLNCSKEREIEQIQQEIQTKLGGNYEVDRPESLSQRLKIVGVNEEEFNLSNEALIMKIKKQNGLNKENTKIKILRKSNLFNKRFNIIVEVDSDIYRALASKDRVSVGWNRCRTFDDFGVVRCFNCCKYGHLQKECREKKSCEKCAEEHEAKNCKSTIFKCRNCVDSNIKYGMSLDVGHVCWDVVNCKTYARVEQIQQRKFQK